MYLILSEADRERLQCPEKLLVKLADVTAREQATLQHAFGWDDSFAMMQGFAAMYQYDAEKDITLIRPRADELLALAWLGLRRAAVFTATSRTEMATELDQLDIQMFQVQIQPDEEEHAAAEVEQAAAEGKDSSSTPTKTSIT